MHAEGVKLAGQAACTGGEWSQKDHSPRGEYVAH